MSVPMAQAPQVPDYILQRQPTNAALNANLLSGLGGNSPPYISIKGNRFTFNDGQGNTREWNQLTLNVVIIDVNQHVSKVFYDKAWDPNADYYEAPACWSDNGVGPSASAERPQSATCASCPQAAWGSKINTQTNAKSKACQDSKKLAVMVPDFENRVFLLKVPPASLKNLGKYAHTVASYNLGPRFASLDDMLTQLSFEAQSVGVLQFNAAGYTPQHTYPLIAEATKDGKTDTLLGRNDIVRSAALPAPVAAPVQALPQPAHQPFSPPPTQITNPYNGAVIQQHAAPFAPPPVQSGYSAVTPPQPMQQAPMPGFPQSQAEAPKGRGRPKKTEQPAFGPAPQAMPQQQAQPFGPAPQQAPQPAQAQPGPQQAFGMVASAPMPPADVTDAIAKLMSM